MRNIDLTKYSETELTKLEERIKEERERRGKLEVLKQQFEQIAKESGLTLDEVMGTPEKRGRPRKKRRAPGTSD